MAEYLYFVCVSHGKKLLTKSSAIKEAQRVCWHFGSLSPLLPAAAMGAAHSWS